MVPFRPMSATSEVPAAFRNAAGNPGPLALVREGIADIRSRRRLVRYLVQADVHKRGADTLLGNIWWVLDPLLQMLVYVVFVTIIVPNGTPPDYPLFIFSAILPWKWFSASITDATVVDRQPGPADQADPVPQDRPAGRGDDGGDRQLRVRDRRARDADALLLRPDHAVAACSSRSSPSSSSCSPWRCSFLVAAGNVFFRDLGNVVGHVLRLWWFLSPGLYSLASLDQIKVFKDHAWLTTLANANPFAILFEAYRSVIYGTPTTPPSGPPNMAALAVLLVGEPDPARR